MVRFDPNQPFNDIPLLPVDRAFCESPRLLKLEARARAAVSELKGYAHVIPNQDILINAAVLREAKDSSEIENIVTTQDQLYRASALSSAGTVDPAAKEVLRYRAALWYGFGRVKSRGILTIPDIMEIQRIIVENDAGLRRTTGTALVNDRTGETVYTPPQGESKINKLLSNLAECLNNNDESITKSAVIHYQFEAIHPFYDGNGRTGRIINVLYLVLKKHLEIPILYLSSRIITQRADYYRLLREVSSGGAWEEWTAFYLRTVETTAQQSIRTIARIKEQLDYTVDYVRSRAPRIYSQELVETVFRQPYCRSAFIERAAGVERKAASRYLHQLENIGLLEKRKIGRHNIFINTALLRLLSDSPGE